MNHPYKKYEHTALWRAIDVALADLERNHDVKISTSRSHVIGLLCKRISDEGLAKLIADQAAELGC